ncbi:MAG: DUF362 domain-containing protein [Anaerolineales bacterium]|nr:DUF362 domain-containing protein [Anaerolineales bacterium]
MRDALAPLGGLERFVRPGMRVLLKPNMLTAAPPERAVTTHPALIETVARLVREVGGVVSIGDSPGGSVKRVPEVWRDTGIAEAAARLDVALVPFESAVWERLDGLDYFIARPLREADLVINLPKLKTHQFALYTGGVKNLFGAVPGSRKRELHVYAPGIQDFSHILVDVLELVPTGLTIMDGILGQEGNGPGLSGTPRRYNCLLASADPVALDAIAVRALGYQPAQVEHIRLAGVRGLGVSDPAAIELVGDRQSLAFAPVRLPAPRWYFHAPAWTTRAATGALRIRPQVEDGACVGCGACIEVCPRGAIMLGRPPIFDLGACIGCMCCAEICPQGAITPRCGLLARLIGLGR